MRAKVLDFKIQRDGFKSSLTVHEATMKHMDAEIKSLNQNLIQKESGAKELYGQSQGLLKKVAELRNKVNLGDTNLMKILQTKTDAILMLNNVDDEKVELEKKTGEPEKTYSPDSF